MSNPFNDLGSKPAKTEPNYDEWEGQFSCSTYKCWGYAKVARYYAKAKLLVWECQDGHTSKLEGVDE